MTIPNFIAYAIIPLLAAAIRVNQAERFLSLELRSATIPGGVRRARDQAQSIPEVDLTDMTNAFTADIAIGSPPQPMTLIIDTGSSSLWVNPNCVWAENQQICSEASKYDLTKSQPAPKRVPELDGYQDYASGDWTEIQGYSDVFWLDDDRKILNQAFGIANDSNGVYLGFIGLGPDLQTGFDSEISNYSLLNSMVDQGMINSRTYSLGLETNLTFGAESPSTAIVPRIEVCHADCFAESLIFGGLDKNMYTGNFARLPVQPPGNGGGDENWR